MNEIQHVVLRRRMRRPFPVGMVAGLLAASLATLIGVFSGVEPFAIAIRASVSGLSMGMVLSLGMSLIRAANLEPDQPLSSVSSLRRNRIRSLASPVNNPISPPNAS